MMCVDCCVVSVFSSGSMWVVGLLVCSVLSLVCVSVVVGVLVSCMLMWVSVCLFVFGVNMSVMLNVLLIGCIVCSGFG